MQTYTAVIEKDAETELFVGYVPGVPGAHSQASTLDELRRDLAEVLALLAEEGIMPAQTEFIGTQQIVIP